ACFAILAAGVQDDVAAARIDGYGAAQVECNMAGRAHDEITAVGIQRRCAVEVDRPRTRPSARSFDQQAARTGAHLGIPDPHGPLCPRAMQVNTAVQGMPHCRALIAGARVGTGIDLYALVLVTATGNPDIAPLCADIGITRADRAIAHTDARDAAPVDHDVAAATH